MNCKNDAGACQCWEHMDGLKAYSTDQDAYTAALTRCRPSKVILSVVTREDILGIEHACDNTMVCPCRNCETQRDQRQAVTVLQPWQPRPPRHREAA